jgi:hypothetical protein
MKAEDTARTIVDEWRNGAVWSFPELQKRIALAIKNQDRDTRHACAEEVNALPWEVQGDTDSMLFGSEALISRDAAHSACMNAKGFNR